MKPDVNTDRLIKDSLFFLCREKGLARISVSDLSRKANINRGTFYLHYENLNNLVKEIEDELLRDLEQISASHIYFDGMDKYLWYRSAVKSHFYRVKDRVDWFSILLSPTGDPSFSNKVYRFIWMDAVKKYNSVNLSWDHTTLEFATIGDLSIFSHWLRTDAKLDVDRLVDMMNLPFHRGQSRYGR